MTQLKIDPTWNLDAMFPTIEAWENEFKSLTIDFEKISEFQGTLSSSPQALLGVLEMSDEALARASRLKTYGSLLFAADTGDDTASVLYKRGKTLEAEVQTAQAFLVPEILALGQDKVSRYIDQLPGLERFQFQLCEVERLRMHTRSAEVERTITALEISLNGPEEVHTALNDSDLRFAPINVDGKFVDFTQGDYDELTGSPDRTVRQATFENYADQYVAHKQTFAATLTHHAQMNFVFAAERGYRSTLEQKLAVDGLPESVFQTVLQVCRESRPLFQRYFKLKAGVLGLDRLAEYDIHAPLGKNPPNIPYEKAVELVIDAVAPLGREYQAAVRKGLCDERWADVYPRPGKFSNAFSSGTFRTLPYLLLNYSSRMSEVGTLAHETGHSMHSKHTNDAQPFCYIDYSMTVAETASNLNQVLLRDITLQSDDAEVVLAGLDEAFLYLHRYLFLFPTLTEVEHYIHEKYAAKGAVGADEICAKTVEAYSAAYGDSVEFDEKRLGMKWAQFSHLFAPYYIFQYGVGIASAMVIGERILQGDTRTREQYIKFLQAGASMPVTDIFRLVDIDITSPEVYRQAFKLMEKYLDRLENFVP